MFKLLLFGLILFFVYRLFIKPFLVPVQANAPLDQLQDLISKLQQQQKGQRPQQNSRAGQSNRANDEEEYTDYEEIK
jgi:hypothetical protein